MTATYQDENPTGRPASVMRNNLQLVSVISDPLKQKLINEQNIRPVLLPARQPRRVGN